MSEAHHCSRINTEYGRSSRSCSSSPWTNSSSDSEDNFDSMSSSSSDRSSLCQPPTSLYWVRMSALRNHDNQAFATAFSDPETRFRAVFIIDPWYMDDQQKMGLNRLRFLLESLHDIDNQLRSYGTQLYVAKGHPLATLEKICSEWNVTKLMFQADRDMRSFIVEDTLEKLAHSMNIEVHKFQGHTLFNTDRILESIQINNQPLSLKDFRNLLPHLGTPDFPCQSPQLKKAPPDNLEEKEKRPEEYSIPSLSDFGYSESEALYTNKAWVGGETEALRRLAVYIRKRKTQSNNLLKELCNSSSLSPYIRFGCLSVRYFFWKLKEMVTIDPGYEELMKEVTSKLLMREFYFALSAQVPDIDQCSNKVSIQFPWDQDDILLRSWAEGKTGYPWIDAAMRQLRQEGWIHHCLRESVATFLTRGDLWISWVEGKNLFAELMLDFEPCVSCGCWMKSSSSAFITGPVEHYCPITFGQKIDPHGTFIRQYIPELQEYPDQYIYCPWMAPPEVQARANCVLGVDYPHPIIDHQTAGVLCCEKLRSIMKVLQHRNSVSSP